MTELAIDGRFKRLIEGRMMRCPRCKREEDILRYKPMGFIEEFARDTTMIYKCSHCRWLFAPSDDIVAYLLGGRGNGESDHVSQ